MHKEGELFQTIFSEKAIIFLYYIEELSIEEISCIEKVSPQRIQKVLNNYINIFRRRFNFIDFSSNNFIELMILFTLTKSMQENTLNEEQSKRIYKNIILKIKETS